MNMSELIPPERLANGQYWSKTLTLVKGCTPVSEGCAHCWSAAMASRFDWGNGFAEGGKWTGKVEPNWKVLEWLEKRARSKRVLKPQVFCIWNDFCHPGLAKWDFRTDAMNAMIACQRDIFLILTKRPEGFLEMYSVDGTIPSNIWIGVTVELDKYACRLVNLCKAWPGRKFVSIEPCLGPIDVESWLWHSEVEGHIRFGESFRTKKVPSRLVDWVILGGETGPHARPLHPDWVRSVRDQCVEAGVPFFFKHWGEWGFADHRRECFALPDGRILMDLSFESCGPDFKALLMGRIGKKKAGRLLDGKRWDEMPEVKP